MRPFTQQVVLLTGASSGIGEATAIRLRQRGFIVYAAARRVERMQHLTGLGVHVLPLDVTDEASLKKCGATDHDSRAAVGYFDQQCWFW